MATAGEGHGNAVTGVSRSDKESWLLGNGSTERQHIRGESHDAGPTMLYREPVSHDHAAELLEGSLNLLVQPFFGSYLAR